jgi:glycosyltransferase involved in cell wall biosynthesis
MFNDVVIIPDLFGWITGRWAQELAKNLRPSRTLVVPSWFPRSNPRVYRRLIRRSSVIVNIDPWFAKEAVERLPKGTRLASVLHHVNEDDPNAAYVARADLPVAACAAAAEHLQQRVGPNKRVLLVENGVDLEEFRPLNKAECRKAFGLERQSLLVGYCGKASSDYRGRKGLDILQRVIAELGSNRDVEFVFCGGGWEDWCKATGVSGAKVTQLGFIERNRLGQFYNAMDVVLSTSRNEAGPASVLEAMACGVPVVASQTGIVDKVVVHGRNGFYHPPGNAEGLVQSLGKLGGDRGLAARLGVAARESVERDWSWGQKMLPLADAVRERVRGGGRLKDLGWPVRRLFEGYLRRVEGRRFKIE